MHSGLFPFAEYWWFYLTFTGFVAVLLTIDLTLHRKAHVISLREATAWMSVWIALALAFNVGLYLYASSRFDPAIARQLGLEFLAGYLVEESLSIDNMFVFALVFQYFAVPPQYQHRVLFYGVLGAMVFRAIFIAIGSTLVQFHWVMVLFGVFLIFTGVRMAVEREKAIHPGDNPVVKLAHRFFPVTRDLYGPRFFVTLNGVKHFTPLMIVLLVLETTDIVFAVDSVPAVFGVTSEPLIVYTSNVFAILGLRSMYFLLSGAMGLFHALRYGLAAVLVFVGLKMVWLDGASGGRFPIGISLAVIISLVSLSIVVSLVFPKVDTETKLERPSGRLAVGAFCLLLSALDLLIAFGPLRRYLPPEAFQPIRAEWLFVSGGCFAASGVLLLLGPRGADQLTYYWRRSRARVDALHQQWNHRRHSRAK